MGQARANLNMDAAGIPRPRDPRCPACNSGRTMAMPLEKFSPAFQAIGVTSDWHGCLDCRAVWEPFPPLYARDPVCAEPCDNCAFRPGSPEQRDKERWRRLMDTLKSNEDGARGRFYCHKGVPIDMARGPGNFLFPRKLVEMDGQVVEDKDGAVTMEDTDIMRVCSGYLRMVWAINGISRT